MKKKVGLEANPGCRILATQITNQIAPFSSNPACHIIKGYKSFISLQKKLRSTNQVGEFLQIFKSTFPMNLNVNLNAMNHCFFREPQST
jgi:hypothetical protein